jgi:hypothetical protein
LPRDHLVGSTSPAGPPVIDLSVGQGGSAGGPTYRLIDPSPAPAGARRRIAVALASAGVIIGFAAGIVTASSPWIRRQFVLSFTHEPSNFADLYFSTPTDLPSTFTPGVPFTIPIGVTNVSDATHDYTLLLSARRAGEPTENEGSVEMTVQPHQAASREVSLLLPADTTRLDVALADHPRTVLQLHLKRVSPNVH